MQRIRIRNSGQRKWRRLRWLSVIGLFIAIILAIFLEMNALPPDRLSNEGQYCKFTTDWVGEAFAVEMQDDEEVYDFHIARIGDMFMIVKVPVNDEEMGQFLDTLFDEDGNYLSGEKELQGASMPIERDLKSLAMEEFGYYVDEVLPVTDFSLYFYPYGMDTTTDGHLTMVIIWGMVFALLCVIGVIGGLIAAARHYAGIQRLKNELFYERFMADWSRSGRPMDTRNEKLIVLGEFMVVPDYPSMVLKLSDLAWCYEAGRRGRKVTLYIMDMNGSLKKLCVIKEKSGKAVSDYLEMIHRQAPWCRIGYTPENRQAFGGMNKKSTLTAIATERDEYLSHYTLSNGY